MVYFTHSHASFDIFVTIYASSFSQKVTVPPLILHSAVIVVLTVVGLKDYKGSMSACLRVICHVLLQYIMQIFSLFFFFFFFKIR